MKNHNIDKLTHSKDVYILFALVKRDLVGRYKNSILGFCWHFLMPILLIIVYYIAFASFRGQDFQDYAVYLAVGLFPFTFLTSNLTTGTNCIISHGYMLKKMSFKREYYVWAQLISTLVVMMIGLGVTLMLAFLVGHHISLICITAIPLCILLTFIFAAGYVFLLSAISVYIRDIQYLLTAISVTFYFITPVYYVTENLQEPLHTITWLNPFTYYVEFIHSLAYSNELPMIEIIFVCLVLSIGTFVVGYSVFKRLKKGFAERL